MLTAAQVAVALDWPAFTVRRIAAEHKIGQRLGEFAGDPDNRPWVFSQDDIERLRPLKRDNWGRPRLKTSKKRRRKSISGKD